MLLRKILIAFFPTFALSCNPDIGGLLFISPSKWTWNEAQIWCEHYGGTLANGNDDAIWAVVTSDDRLKNDLWMGLSNDGGATCEGASCMAKLTW